MMKLFLFCAIVPLENVGSFLWSPNIPLVWNFLLNRLFHFIDVTKIYIEYNYSIFFKIVDKKKKTVLKSNKKKNGFKHV